MTFPITIDTINSIRIVRDDLIPGGSKRRALTPLIAELSTQGWNEFVFGGSAEGYAQLALAYSTSDVPNTTATCFVAQRKTPHKHTIEAANTGAKIVQVPHGRLNVVQAKARAYCADTGAYFFPLGFDTPEFKQHLTDQIRAAVTPIADQITETWCVAGSGLLARCLQAALPNTPNYPVRIGFKPTTGTPRRQFTAPERFADQAQHPPPFPSCANYDAKAWRFIQLHAKPGALFWNVGA